MQSAAVVLDAPRCLALRTLALAERAAGDLVVDVEWSGISTGTERLLWSGRMPEFPGMGYPLVPGYESVGTVREAAEGTGIGVGTRVFVPGARCFGPVRSLFGGAAATLVVPAARVTPVPAGLGSSAVLLALAATAWHVSAGAGGRHPELIVGHGVLGRLIARIAVAAGATAPTVWETEPRRCGGARGYEVVAPAADERRDYRLVCDASGDASLLDALVARLAPRGEIILAGFYHERPSFAFPPAFMRELRLSVSAEFTSEDLAAVGALVASGALSLDDLVTHGSAPQDVDAAYRTAFEDVDCLKMVLDWRNCA